MSALPAIAANLWLVGLPVTLMIAAALALLQRAPGRCRYLVALVGFVAAAVVPVLATREGAPVVVAATEIPANAAGARSTLDPGALLVMVWLGGAALLIARELRAHRHLARARRSWAPAGPALRQAVAVRAERSLWLADVPSPCTLGLIAPAIVLPRTLVGALDDAVARRIVAHEEAHARWRDPLVHALVRLVRAALWIAPALWIAERLVAREREAAADEAALRGEADEVCARYATTLVELGRSVSRRVDLLAVRLGAAADLEYRVRRILRLSRARLGTAVSALAVLLAGALALAFAPRSEAPGRITVLPDGGGAAAVAAHETAIDAGPHPPPDALGASFSARAGETVVAAMPPTETTTAVQRPAPASPEPASPAGADPELASAEPLDRGLEQAGSAPTSGTGPSDDWPVFATLAPALSAPAATQTDLARVASEPAAEAPRRSSAAASADLGTGDHVHRDVHVDVHVEDAIRRVALRNGDRGDDEVIVLRDVDRIRTVIRSSDGRGYRVREEDDGGRSKHPVALFHRAVTSPIKRWLRTRAEPAPAAPAAPRSLAQ